MATPGPGPHRSSSVYSSSNMGSPYSSHPSSAAPVSPNHLLLHSLLQQTVFGFDFNPDYFPIPSDADLRDFLSEGTIITHLFCAALAGINAISPRCFSLEKLIEEICAIRSLV